MSAKPTRQFHLRACAPCAKLKIRCDYDAHALKCKRCVRLNRECQSQPVGSHSNKKPRRKEVDIARLESIIDSMSQMAATASEVPRELPTPRSSSAVSLALPELDDDLSELLPQGDDAVASLRLFVEEMAPMFPFIVIPPDVKPEQLRSEKPLLYNCLMMITCQSDLDRQTKIARVVGLQIAESAYARREKDLPLLQGILLYVSWYQVHQHLGQFLVTLMSAVVSMVMELGLDHDTVRSGKIRAGGLRTIESEGRHCPARTLEERRVYLGVLWMASVIKIYIIDVLVPPFSKYTEECCSVLEGANAHPNDAYLVYLIRIQRLAEKIEKIVYDEGLDAHPTMTTPLSIAIAVFEDEIALIPPYQLPHPIQAALSIAAHQMLQIHLYKLAAEDIHFPTTAYATLRANLLLSCFSATNRLLDTICALPAWAVLSLPYAYWGMTGHTIKIRVRLSEARHGAWAPKQDAVACARLIGKIKDTMVEGQCMNPIRKFPEVYEKMEAKLKSLDGSGGAEGEVDPGIVEGDTMGGILYDLLEWI